MNLVVRYLANLGGGGSAGTGEGGAGETSVIDLGTMMRDSSKVIKDLFPVTLEDPRTGRQYWHEPARTAQVVARELFER